MTVTTPQEAETETGPSRADRARPVPPSSPAGRGTAR